MYIGHYGFAFYLKKKTNEIPLWLIFLSVQLVDFLCFILIIFGIERMKYIPNLNPWLRTHLEYFPYSHSLITNVILAFFIFFIFWKFKDKIWGIILSIGVISHWFIDFLVHTPDLPLYLDRYKVGLGLWQLPWVTFFIEIIIVIAGFCYLYKGSGMLFRPLILIVLMFVLISKMFFSKEDPEIVTTNMTIRAIIPLIVNSIFVAMAYWVEQKKVIQNQNQHSDIAN